MFGWPLGDVAMNNRETPSSIPAVRLTVICESRDGLDQR
jgi:hypothetical protein